MRKRVLILVVAAAMLVLLGHTAPATARKTSLLEIKSPSHKQTCLQDEVKVVVELKKGADPDTFRAWLNSKEITHLFQPNGNTLTAAIGLDEGLRAYAEDIQTTRDDKGVWFIEGRKLKLRAKQARYVKRVTRRFDEPQAEQRMPAVDTPRTAREDGRSLAVLRPIHSPLTSAFAL